FLLLGGRQPLCGIGVISTISVTSNPELPMERIAESRPEPGPFTNTFTLRIPASNAFLPASSEANWAAKGVFFFAPRKPIFPALDQETVCPFRLVKVIMILLKVALIWACPAISALTVLFLTVFAALSVAPCCCAFAIYRVNYYLVAIFLLAMVLRLPLRVRALVCVFCPRTGKPIR